MASPSKPTGRGSSEQDYLPASSTKEDIDRYFVVRDAQKLFFDSCQETLDIYWWKKWDKFENLHTMQDDAFQMCRIKLVKHMPRLDELKSKWWSWSTLISRTALIDMDIMMGRKKKSFISQIHNHEGVTNPRDCIVRPPKEDDTGDVLSHVPSAPKSTQADLGNSELMDRIPSNDMSPLDSMSRDEDVADIIEAAQALAKVSNKDRSAVWNNITLLLKGSKKSRKPSLNQSIIETLSDAVSKIRRDREAQL
jgi:hypothetical protein